MSSYWMIALGFLLFLRAGKSIIVAEPEVFSVESGREKLVAKLTETCAVIEQK